MPIRLILTVLAAIVWAAAALAQGPAGKRVALIIANAEYEGHPRLPNPSNDADLIAQTLRDPRMGFGSNVRVLKNLKSEAMRDALQQFAAESQGADFALLYFAGHGIEVSKNNFLIPTDAQLATSSAVEFEAISLDLALRSMDGARGLKVVVLDACRTNPFIPKMRMVSAGRAVGRGLARVTVDSPDTLIAYAAGEGQVASDGKGTNSPYALAFARQIKVPGLEIRLLFGRVRDDVQRQERDQAPVTFNDLGGTSYYFVPPAAAAASAPPAPFDPRQMEMTFWESIKGSKNKADFEAYLRQYPNGAFAALARNRIAPTTIGSPALSPMPGEQRPANSEEEVIPTSLERIPIPEYVSPNGQAAQTAFRRAGIEALAGNAVGSYMDRHEAGLRQRLHPFEFLSVRRIGNNLSVTFESDALFDQNKVYVKPTNYYVLSLVGEVGREFDRTFLEVSGHTDSQGAADTNQVLSQNLSIRVTNILLQNGLSGYRLMPAGFGETRPIASNASATGRALNRRLEILFIPFTE